MTNRYAVFGQPIAHSLSPIIHEKFADLTLRRITYERMESTPDTFSHDIENWQASGAKGCNITMPFKGLAYEICDVLDQSAQHARAVNTLYFNEQGKRLGFNTDGSGLLQDLSVNNGFSIQGKRVLIIGAGGAARGVLGPLLARDPAHLCIVNRSTEKARMLARSFSTNENNISACGYEHIRSADQFDLVINATSLSLQGAIPALPQSIFAEGSLSYDMVYRNTDTSFMRWSIDNNASVACDGLGMLIEQAADAFAIWEGVRPETESVYAAIKENL